MSDKHILDMIIDYSRRQMDPDPMKCLCSHWARICPAPAEINQHHKACPLFIEPAAEPSASPGVEERDHDRL